MAYDIIAITKVHIVFPLISGFQPDINNKPLNTENEFQLNALQLTESH